MKEEIIEIDEDGVVHASDSCALPGKAAADQGGVERVRLRMLEAAALLRTMDSNEQAFAFEAMNSEELLASKATFRGAYMRAISTARQRKLNNIENRARRWLEGGAA